MPRILLTVAALLLGSGCYLAHGIEGLDAGPPPRDAGPIGRDAGLRRDAGSPTVPACEVRLERCAPVHEAALQLFDQQSQSPEIVWGPDRLLLAFWAPGDEGSGGPQLLHLDLDGRVIETVPLPRGYNETHLAWNPRIAQGLFSAESGLTWIGADGYPTESAWLSPDERFRSTFDVGPTEDGFAVALSGRGLETQLGTSVAPGELDWIGTGRVDGAGPALADRWTGELRGLAGGSLLRHDGAAWDAPIAGVEGDGFAPNDVFTFGGALFTLHSHYDGRHVVRRWTLDGALVREATVGPLDDRGSARLFAMGATLAVVATHLTPDAAIHVAELDPDTLELGRTLFEVAPPPPVFPYNRHSIALTQTPRGLAFVWTEGAVGSGNMRPFLRLYECCLTE
ncbi:MAG: hypothetical protein H6719_35580 [Sandaracinaceae bacterium]|nr:hypothetical protein [Sandaracinaceae bacterium]